MLPFTPVPAPDTRTWRTATLSAPFVVQGLVALLIINMWLLGKGPFTTESGHSERAWILAATVITIVESALVTGALLVSPSSRRRGLALSTASCSVAVIVGVAIFGYLILR